MKNELARLRVMVLDVDSLTESLIKEDTAGIISAAGAIANNEENYIEFYCGREDNEDNEELKHEILVMVKQANRIDILSEGASKVSRKVKNAIEQLNNTQLVKISRELKKTHRAASEAQENDKEAAWLDYYEDRK